MGEQDKSVKIFDYIPDLDAFKTTKEYDRIAQILKLYDWNPVTWIGMFFALDNNFGEHWFDDDDKKNELAKAFAQKHNLPPFCNDYTEIMVRWYGLVDSKLKEMYGVNSHQNLMIINPSSFDPQTRPACHSPEQRKRFWTDVLKSLHLSLETVFDEARDSYGRKEELHDMDSNFPFKEMNIEKRIEKIKEKFKQENAKPDKRMIKIFDYDEEVNAFTATEEYKELAFALKLYEEKGMIYQGNPVRWIGRFFTMDDDYGEICFDNWQDREYIKACTGYEKEKLKEFYTINPDKLADGDDGPYHSSAHRKKFWTDALKSLRISLDTLFEEARSKYLRELELVKKYPNELIFEDHLHGKEYFNLEKKIEEIKAIYA